MKNDIQKIAVLPAEGGKVHQWGDIHCEIGQVGALCARDWRTPKLVLIVRKDKCRTTKLIN